MLNEKRGRDLIEKEVWDRGKAYWTGIGEN